MSLVNMTENAVQNVKRLQEEFDLPGFGLRFGISGGGCSGYKYVLELEEEPRAHRRLSESRPRRV